MRLLRTCTKGVVAVAIVLALLFSFSIVPLHDPADTASAGGGRTSINLLPSRINANRNTVVNVSGKNFCRANGRDAQACNVGIFLDGIWVQNVLTNKNGDFNVPINVNTSKGKHQVKGCDSFIGCIAASLFAS